MAYAKISFFFCDFHGIYVPQLCLSTHLLMGCFHILAVDIHCKRIHPIQLINTSIIPHISLWCVCENIKFYSYKRSFGKLEKCTSSEQIHLKKKKKTSLSRWIQPIGTSLEAYPLCGKEMATFLQ